MIDPATAGALDRINARNEDVRNAYRPGFIPQSDDVARPPRIVPAADPLSVALPEGAYLVTPDAAGELSYSRDGTFTVSGGQLQASDGRPVLGFALGNRKLLVPLRVDPYDAALGRVTNERVESDGTVSYTRRAVDPRTGERRAERVALGRVALARFPAGTQPDRIDALHVRPPHGVAPQLGVPADGAFGALATSARDLGRVDIVTGLEKMKEAYVSFEALRAAHHGRGETEKIALDLVK
jgi:flagellar basal body rod protein FlgG